MTKRAERVLIWGASGHAKVVADILICQKQYKIISFIDDINKKKKDLFLGTTVLTTLNDVLLHRKKGIRSLIVATGDCGTRLKLARKAQRMGFDLINAIHLKAIVAKSVRMGLGNVVVAGAVLGPDVRVGDGVIINTGATVDHDCDLQDGVHIGPGVHIGGGTIIGRGAWVGIGATVVDHVCIGKNTIIGAGAVVTKDIPDNVVAYGCPAKIIRKIK